ncbi:MAG: HD domain-containing protein [Opitutaceae bacterium]|nr:HD domain-containing protein [Opitutaceae bacterium]
MPAPRLNVAELRAANRTSGEEFEAVLILRRISTRTARNDNAYLAVELGDKTGSFSANVFADSPLNEALRGAGEGAVVWVSAKIEFYQGRLSPRLLQARLLDEDALAEIGGVDSLVETTPEDVDALRAEFAALTARIEHAPLRRTVELAIESVADRFHTAPAAVAMHHAYRSGLLEHTVHVTRAAVALLPLYPEICADLVIAGCLLHDIGKAIEYAGALTARKTRTGQLQGHVVLGYRLVRRAALTARLGDDLVERLEHIILSHQGELEWGAAVMAATPEAVFVSMVDNLDARMGMVQRALRNGGEDVEFSEFLPGLKSVLLRTRPQFPLPESETPVTATPAT